jgi:glycosyltransferase involved in cell wall biosynthesis
MKVLQISQYYTPHIGGVEKHLSKINQELIKKNHQVRVLAGNENLKLLRTELIDQIKVDRIDNRYSHYYKFKIWRQIVNHRNLFKEADIIHIHGVFWWIIPLYPFIFHKLFITFHGHESSDKLNNKAIFWHRLANRFCKGSIVVGGFHEKYYGVKADYIIYGASDQEMNNPNNKNLRKIIFVGRLVPETGILEYLEALNILKNKKINYHLDVFGDGPLMNQAKQFSKNYQLDVTFRGAVAKAEQLFSHYPIAFVSRYLSICEALKQHCQVIAHYHNQLIKDYLAMSIFKDYIFMTNNSQKIAQAIIKTPRTKKFDKKISTSLTWPVIADTYQKLWQKK